MTRLDVSVNRVCALRGRRGRSGGRGVLGPRARVVVWHVYVIYNCGARVCFACVSRYATSMLWLLNAV